MAATSINKQHTHHFSTAYFQRWRQILRRMYKRNMVLWSNDRRIKGTIGR